jgi:hypothetical protein
MSASAILQVVGQIAGLGGLALGVFLLLFRDLIRKAVLPGLSREQAYRFLRMVALLVWTVAIAGLLCWTSIVIASRTGDRARNERAAQAAQRLPARRDIRVTSSKVYFPGGKEARWVTRVVNFSGLLSPETVLEYAFEVPLTGVRVQRPKDIGAALSENAASRVEGEKIFVRVPPIPGGNFAEIIVEAQFREQLNGRVAANLVLKDRQGKELDRTRSTLEIGPGSFRTVHDPRWYEIPPAVREPEL